MDLDLDGCVIVVTGGTKGIGLACAQALAAEGARVAIVSRSQANVDAALAKLAGASRPAFGIATDLRDYAQTSSAMLAVERTLGPIEGLVNSAGAARRYAPSELDAAAWHDAMDAKYFTYMHPIQALLPGMAARGRGVIVNIIGMGGKVAAPVHLPGGAANAALMLATVGLAHAYGRQGVRINGINPGATSTERVNEGLAAEARASGIAADEIRARSEAKIPLGRFAEPEEIARVALFLLSPRTTYVSGAIVPMDGSVNPVL